MIELESNAQKATKGVGVPVGWKMVELREICVLNMGQSPDSSTYNDRWEWLPFYQGKTDFGFQYPTPRMYCTDPKKISEQWDILMSVRAPVGPVNFASEKCCIGRWIGWLRAKKDLLDQGYLYFRLIYEEKNIASLWTGSIFQAINKAQLSTFSISLPQLREQEIIAKNLFSIQIAISEQRNMIEKLRELKQSMMHELFTHGTRGEKIKMTDIREVPESWEVTNLSQFCHLNMGQSPSSETYNRDGRWLPFFQWKTDFWRMYPVPRIFCSDSKKIAECWDILISVRAPVWPLNIANESCCIGRWIWWLRAFWKLHQWYLYFRLMFDEATIARLWTGSIFQAINKSQLANFQIPLPSLDEQKLIASSLSEIDQSIEMHIEKFNSLESLFQTLLHELMSGERRVNL